MVLPEESNYNQITAAVTPRYQLPLFGGVPVDNGTPPVVGTQRYQLPKNFSVGAFFFALC